MHVLFTPGCKQESGAAPKSLELAEHFHALNKALAALQVPVQAHCHIRVTQTGGGRRGDLVGSSQKRNTQKKDEKTGEAEGSHLEVVVRKDAQTMRTPGGTPMRPTAR